MDEWKVLFELLILLGAALALGTLAERCKQSAIIGYLLAGAIVGSEELLGLVARDHVDGIAELGVALLLFSIGLEFSFKRLVKLGPVALIGGTFQVLVTLAVGALCAVLLGLDSGAAIIVGAIFALSSTACVLRLLVDKQLIDSVYGRSAMGILLLQDIAVLPLTVVVAALSTKGSAGDVLTELGVTGAFAVALIVGFYLLFNLIVPRLLNLKQWARNRDHPVLLAIVSAMGSAYAAHAVGIPPAIGAFIAGLMLAGSPFATQVRADVGALRTVLVTLFFASVGMMANPSWMAQHLHWVVLLVAAVVVGKTLVVWAIGKLLRLPRGTAIATGLCLAQIGEFSFVLATIAYNNNGVLSEFVFNLIISATILTLLLTPFLIHLATLAANRLNPATTETSAGEASGDKAEPGTILIVGFGPAAQEVASSLMADNLRDILVLDMNPRNASIAEQFGLTFMVGDARYADVLNHAHIERCRVAVVTLPDANAARHVIELIRNLNPQTYIIVRARYHVTRWELALAGATVVVDEEEQVGTRMAIEAKQVVEPEQAPDD